MTDPRTGGQHQDILQVLLANDLDQASGDRLAGGLPRHFDDSSHQVELRLIRHNCLGNAPLKSQSLY